MRQADLFDPPPYRVTKLDLKGHDMNINDIFESKYLKSSEFKNRSISAVIERWEIETLGDDRKLVLYFQGVKKGMVVNKTNADRLSHLYGPDTDDWIGREIVLCSEVTNYQGRAMDGLRVRAPEPPPVRVQNSIRPAATRARPIPADEPPDWEPDR